MAVLIGRSQAAKAEHQEIDRMLVELEGLSDEDSQRLLAEEGGEQGR
jgi:hypothetical protein